MIMKRLNKKPDAPEARHSDMREQITAIARAIIGKIENGYEKKKRDDWQKLRLPAMNLATGHVYTGGNRWLLNYLAQVNDWVDPRFVTYKQCAALADADGNPAHVKKGTRATKILRPVPFDKKLEMPPDYAKSGDNFFEEDGKLYTTVRMIGFQCISVFNVSQTTINTPPLPGLTPRDWMDSDFFEKFITASGVAVKNDHPSQAYYTHAHDAIHMPSKDAFSSADQYYAALMHEFFHATAHSARMNRGYSEFGDEKYAMEELRAELFSIACCDFFGLDYSRDKQAGYIDDWAATIDEGRAKTILKAASEVDEILGIVLDAASGKQPKANWFPKVDFTDFPTPLKQYMEHPVPTDNHTADASDRDICKALLPNEQFAALEQGAVGASSAAYLDIMREIAEKARTVPGLYAQEPYGDEATAFLLVTDANGISYYLTELDLGSDTAFGYTADETGAASPGEIPLAALRSLNGRLDIEFSPETVSNMIRSEPAFEKCNDPFIESDDDGPSLSM